METIELKELTFFYPGRSIAAVKNLNLTIREGEFVVLCGQSGCGKTTLLRHLKKNLIPNGERTGTCLYCGVPTSQLDERKSASEIGYVQQNPESQIVTDKVWHELAFGLESLGYQNHQMKQKVAEMASYFDLQSWFRKETAYLSGGQKQLLNLASIMAMQPKVLILDEPTAQLDPIAAADFIHTLYQINRDLGVTILISEHRLEELFPIADRVLVMQEGKLIAEGRPEEVGKILAEKNHPMAIGLPVPMRLYGHIAPYGKCPMTVREGREWMGKMNMEVCTASDPKMARKKDENTEKSVISLSRIRYRYQKSDIDIIRDVSFAVRERECYCLLGGNGVGKSTLLKLICGFLRPSDGEIIVASKNGKSVKRKLSIRMLPQDPQAIFTEITVFEELLEAIIGKHMKDLEKENAIKHMLELVQLSGLEEAHPYDLSGGEQQRLALGKILLTEPEIILMDEPTKGLDPFFKLTFSKILSKLKSKGVTILMVSHDVEFCAENGDRCGLMFDGEVVAEGSPQDFFSGNHFYTTVANKVGRSWFPNAVTCKEVSEQCQIALEQSIQHKKV